VEIDGEQFRNFIEWRKLKHEDTLNMDMKFTKVRLLRIYDGRWFEIIKTDEDLSKETRKQAI
jgi:hypothetical protein